jgi:hypothetical protein
VAAGDWYGIEYTDDISGTHLELLATDIRNMKYFYPSSLF